MLTQLALTIPGYGEVEAPSEVPTGGLSGAGGDLIQTLITLFLVVAVIVAVFLLVWSGIQWTMSGGDKQKVESARNRIMFTIIGLVVVFLSFFVINVIGVLFGIDLLNSGSNTTKNKQQNGGNGPAR